MTAFVRPLALLGVVALVAGRALAPALRGVSVGLGFWVGKVEIVGAVASQAFAAAGTMMAIFAVLAASRSRLPLWLRIVALALAGFSILPALWAAHEPVRAASAGLSGAAASALALACFAVSARAPYTRAPGAAIALVAAGGLIRIAVLAPVLLSQGDGAPFANVVRRGGTASFVCDALATALALAWSSSEPSRYGPPPPRDGQVGLTRAGVLIVLAASLLLTRLALRGENPEANALELTAFRAGARLLSTPDADAPLALRLFTGFVAPLTAMFALTRRSRVASLAPAVALALTARGALEMPPCALMLIVAALATALAAQDGRALWAELVRGDDA